MGAYLFKKRIFALLFFLARFLFFGWNIRQNGGEIWSMVKAQAEEGAFAPAELENLMSHEILGRMVLVETYGEVQHLLNKYEFNDFEYVRDKNGFLHYSLFFREEDDQIFYYARNVKRFREAAEADGAKLLFLVTPGKYSREHSDFFPGIPVNDPTNIVYELLFYLRRLGVEAVDLAQYLPGDRLEYEDTFFRTDHHWTVPAAFEAARVIVGQISERFGEELDPENRYTDPASYRQETYYGRMLGSLGRDTGILYAGLEDFTALYPLEETVRFKRVYYKDDGSRSRREGTFTEAFLDMSKVSPDLDYYDDNQYSLYLDSLRTIEEIENLDNPDGPAVFMVRDSYFSPVITFLAPMCSRIDAIWSLEEREDLSVYSYYRDRVDSGISYDYVIIETYPYNINADAFDFFSDDGS